MPFARVCCVSLATVSLSVGIASAQRRALSGCRKVLPVTATRPVDLVVTELAVIGFGNGAATLLETGPGVSVDQVVAATEASLTVPENVPQMQI